MIWSTQRHVDIDPEDEETTNQIISIMKYITIDGMILRLFHAKPRRSNVVFFVSLWRYYGSRCVH